MKKLQPQQRKPMDARQLRRLIDDLIASGNVMRVVIEDDRGGNGGFLVTVETAGV